MSHRTGSNSVYGGLACTDRDGKRDLLAKLMSLVDGMQTESPKAW